MPYRCQVCKDCDSETDVYQSDSDYPSDVEALPRRHTRRYGNTRRSSRRPSRNYFISRSSSRNHRYNRRYSRDRNNKEKETPNKQEYDSDSSTQSDRSYSSKSDVSKNSDSDSESDEFGSLCDTSCSSDSEDENGPLIDKREIGEVKKDVEETKDGNQKEVTVESEVKVEETPSNEVGDVKIEPTIAEENGDKAKTFSKEEKGIQRSIVPQNNEKGGEAIDVKNINKNGDVKSQRSEETMVKIDKSEESTLKIEKSEEPTVIIEKASDNEITEDSDNLTALEQSKPNQIALDQSKSADFGEDNDITRAKREAGRRRQKSNNPRAKTAQKTHRRVKRSFIKMATGIKGSITVPKPKSWKCGTEAKLITLRPKGKFSRFEYRLVANEMKNTIVHHSGCENAGGCFKKYDIVKIQKVINGCLWKRYRHRQTEILNEVGFVNQRMLFHGDMHVNELIQTGFDERYSNVQGMFGAGLYFAKHSSKANQYVFGYMGGTGCPLHKDKSCMICERKILLCRVTLGKTRNHFTANKLAHPPIGYNSVTGLPSDKPGGLKYPEFIVYRGEQVYPEYLITYKIAN